MRHLALALALTAVAACADRDPHHEGGDHDHADPTLEAIGAPVTCGPRLDRYPVAGPHNGGYDLNALNYTCPPHPNHSRDGSDFLAGDHWGNDIFAAKGTPLVAPRAGVVVRAGYAAVSGLRVTIRDDCGWHYFHAHLDTIAPGIVQNARVEAGTPIGTVGNTGNAIGTSPHLHFSIYPEDYERGIDPFPLLQTVDHTSCGGCTPRCDGTVIVDGGCGRGDCAAFGLTCSMATGAPTCAQSGCTPRCDGHVIVGADCGRGDCAAFGATCVMQGGQPTCELACTPRCDGHVIVGADCGRGDCSAFGATCVMQNGAPTCELACTPRCDGHVIVSADCGRGDCSAFGATCAMRNGQPTCELACAPRCDGTVMVGSDCSRGDCGAFGLTCAMQGGQPACVATGCTPRCDGTVMVAADCSRGDCGAFGSTCELQNSGGNLVPQCVLGCRPHCEGNVIVGEDCGRGDCGAFGLTCVVEDLGEPKCGPAPACQHRCDGDRIIMNDCTVGDCGAFGVTCADFGIGPHCTLPACAPRCDGNVIVNSACERGDCGAFGLTCSTAGNTPPHCVFPQCVGPNGLPRPGHVCIGNSRYECLADGTASEAPCPAGQACNACGGCGPTPAETCNFRDDDCDGQVDEGAKNACGGCGPTPAEVCNFLDDDCDGQNDEGVRNACGGCGPTLAEACNYLDDDCDGTTDEGVRNACNHCETVPAETCNYLDDDCDGETDEGLRNACNTCGDAAVEICNDVDDDCDGETDEGFADKGQVCSVGVGACTRSGTMRCAEGGQALACFAVAGEPKAETCNGQDDDCNGETDDGMNVGEPCVAGRGACAGAGVIACEDAGATTCFATEKVCDDNDPCTKDTCDEASGCRFEALEDCCARAGASCPSGEACFEGQCESLLCRACEPATGCPDGAACVSYPGGSACARRCDESACPAGFSCTTFTSDGQLEPVPVCIAESETCEGEAPDGPVCRGDRWTWMRTCDQEGELIEVCQRGCLPGVGCCPEGTSLVDGFCRTDTPVAEPDPDPTPDAGGRRDEGCGGGAASPLAAWIILILEILGARTRRVRARS